jgi:hypothetical protein
MYGSITASVKRSSDIKQFFYAFLYAYGNIQNAENNNDYASNSGNLEEPRKVLEDLSAFDIAFCVRVYAAIRYCR